MQLLLPEIVAEARDLSVPLLALAALAGLFLALAGWWSHRFWAVLMLTVAAGVLGLERGESLGLPPLVASLLLAVGAGLLALSLMRLLAFVLGGLACLLLMKLLAPSVDAPMACLLAGGILATLLYRLWVMLLTSFAGSVLFGYAALALLGQCAEVDVTAWSQDKSQLLNWAGAGLTLVGCVIQFLWSRPAATRADKPAPKSAEKPAEKKEPPRKADRDRGAGPAVVKGWTWVKVPFRQKAA